MKQILLILILIFLGSCGYRQYRRPHQSDFGWVTGVSPDKAYRMPKPYGMVYIPEGTFKIGASDEDPAYSFGNRAKTVSIQGFWMDATEVTNNEYRQFVYWVRDSVTLASLGFIKELKDGTGRIDWNKQKSLKWQEKGFIDKLEGPGLLIGEEERIFGKKEYNVSKLIYYSETFDLKEAAKRENAGLPRRNFLMIKKTPVYPDTLCWVRDFAYSYNEPMTMRYFSHPAFGNYPVVGINWHQANAFCEWRTHYFNSYLQSRKKTQESDYRLPTEAEWEYSARGGRAMSLFPWGNYYLRNKKGCLMANFKPGRGNYPDDGGFYTVRADAYWPNDYGLYCMSGNVAEWTSSYFTGAPGAFSHDLNPDIRYNARLSDLPYMKRKTIRGGSWKDVGYYLQCGTRTYEFQDTAKSYIGFRCVIDLSQ